MGISLDAGMSEYTSIHCLPPISFDDLMFVTAPNSTGTGGLKTDTLSDIVNTGITDDFLRHFVPARCSFSLTWPV